MWYQTWLNTACLSLQRSSALPHSVVFTWCTQRLLLGAIYNTVTGMLFYLHLHQLWLEDEEPTTELILIQHVFPRPHSHKDIPFNETRTVLCLIQTFSGQIYVTDINTPWTFYTIHRINILDNYRLHFPVKQKHNSTYC